MPSLTLFIRLDQVGQLLLALGPGHQTFVYTSGDYQVIVEMLGYLDYPPTADAALACEYSNHDLLS